MEFLSVSMARGRIPSLAEAATSTTLTHNGQPVAVLVPIGEYRAMQALLKLAENPAELAEVMQAHQQVQQGELDEFVELDPDTGLSRDTAAVHDDTG